MEIKRRLGALNKRMTPAIESMNVANEIKEKLRRIEELTTYAETKIARSEERKKNNIPPVGAQQDAKKKADAKEIADLHQAEQDEMLKDQQQHKAQPESKAKPKKKKAEGKGKDHPYHDKEPD